MSIGVKPTLDELIVIFENSEQQLIHIPLALTMLLYHPTSHLIYLGFL